MMVLLSDFHFGSVKNPASRSRFSSARERQFVTVTLSRSSFHSSLTALISAEVSAFFGGGAIFTESARYMSNQVG